MKFTWNKKVLNQSLHLNCLFEEFSWWPHVVHLIEVKFYAVSLFLNDFIKAIHCPALKVSITGRARSESLSRCYFHIFNVHLNTIKLTEVSIPDTLRVSPGEIPRCWTYGGNPTLLLARPINIMVFIPFLHASWIIGLVSIHGQGELLQFCN